MDAVWVRSTNSKVKMARTKPNSSGISFLKVLLFPFKLLIGLILPFVLLIRCSVFMYTQFQWNAWLCLSVGTLATFICVFIYLNYFNRLVSGKKKARQEGARRRNFIVSGLLVAFFVGYVLLFLGVSNAKTTSVRGEYYTVHPLLRMAVGSLIVFDRSLVITDMSRVPADYQDMGLIVKGNSLHYPQKDGFVHALDLRTNDRPEWQNQMRETIFKLLGFRTLRHTGTEDHLHVSLMIHDNPGAL